VSGPRDRDASASYQDRPRRFALYACGFAAVIAVALAVNPIERAIREEIGERAFCADLVAKGKDPSVPYCRARIAATMRALDALAEKYR
jgi:hypothetical protein